MEVEGAQSVFAESEGRGLVGRAGVEPAISCSQITRLDRFVQVERSRVGVTRRSPAEIAVLSADRPSPGSSPLTSSAAWRPPPTTERGVPEPPPGSNQPSCASTSYPGLHRPACPAAALEHHPVRRPVPIAPGRQPGVRRARRRHRRARAPAADRASRKGGRMRTIGRSPTALRASAPLQARHGCLSGRGCGPRRRRCPRRSSPRRCGPAPPARTQPDVHRTCPPAARPARRPARCPWR